MQHFEIWNLKIECYIQKNTFVKKINNKTHFNIDLKKKERMASNNLAPLDLNDLVADPLDTESEFSVKVSIEPNHECEIYEIKYDGQEIYKEYSFKF